jgi:hypothetical protein
LDCDNGYSIIQGETNQNFTPTSSGSYAVTITKNSCTDTSTCETVTIVSVIKNEIPGLFIHPNPTEDLVMIKTQRYNGPIEVKIYDISGRLLKTSTQRVVSFSKYSKGIYMFNISIGEYKSIFKVIKK